jgi:hypothetical protein
VHDHRQRHGSADGDLERRVGDRQLLGHRPAIVGQYPGLKDLVNGIFRPADSGIDYLSD